MIELTARTVRVRVCLILLAIGGLAACSSRPNLEEMTESEVRDLAERGYAEAQVYIATLYAEGRGVPQDFIEAVRWYRKAARQGRNSPNYTLGLVQKAAQLGDAESQYNLGVIYANGQGVPANYEEAVRWYTKAAQQGSTSAQVTLGGIFGEGRGVPQDYVEAMKWYRLAAEHGEPGAQLRLGAMYANGQGLPQDYAEAARWYHEAAEQGNALAQVNLAGMYAHGQGVKADKVLAHMWYNLAAAAGQSDASKYRNTVAENMKPEEIAEAQRLAREWTPRRSSMVQGP